MTTGTIDSLAATAGLLANLVVEATDAALDAQTPGPWSARTVLAHFRDGELLCLRPGLERMLAEDSPVLHVLEGGGWEPGRNRTRDRKELILADFALQRQASVSMLRALQPGDWTRTGRVPGGPLTIREWVERWTAHDAEHLAQLEALLGETVSQAIARRRRRE